MPYAIVNYGNLLFYGSVMMESQAMGSADQWKAVSHPLRIGILGLLAREALTNEELAKALGVASGKLYFHTKKLLDAGLIAPAGTRQKGPLTEKLYRAVARRLTLPEPVKGGEAPPLEPVLLAAVELYRATWHETGGLHGQTEGGYHLVLPHTPERRREFIERLQALVQDFQESAAAPDAPDAPDATPLALTVLLHAVPTPPPPSAPTGVPDEGGETS
jgi:DNA-binding transcriptional ArsR family regulator